MSGYEPGGNSKNNDPFNLDKTVAKLTKKLQDFFSGKNGSNNAQGYSYASIALVVLAVWALSGLFIINPAEKAVVLRFGQYSEVLSPGLHWIARFVDTKYLVDVQKIYSFSLDGDFLTKSSEPGDMPNQYVQVTSTKAGDNLNDQSKNLVNVELNVQYRISDPRSYLFHVVNPDQTVQQVAAGSLSAAIGQMKLDDVLTTGREFLSSKVFEATKQLLASYDSGIEVVAVTLRKVQAPDQVRAAFNDVNRADQDKATYIQQAQAYASKTIPLAQGMAARVLADAYGYQQKAVLTAQANIAKYQALSTVYSGSPEITRERMYLETMQNILSRTSKVLIDGNAGNNLIYLPLDKLLKTKTATRSNTVDTLPAQSMQTTQESDTLSPASVELQNENN